METVCRVCLADDRSTYRVANTALEQTYDVITGVELQRAGRPTALCCVCVSQLRRCRTFIETARESNDALDRWYRSHSHTDSKLPARPLINFTTTTEFVVDSEFWPQVKQEPSDTGDVGPIIIEEIKCEVIRNVIQSHSIHVSFNDGDHTQMLNSEINKGDDIDNDNRKEGHDVGRNNLHVEWVNVQDFVDIEDDKMQLSVNVKHDIQLLDVPESEAASTSNVEEERSSSDQHIASRSCRSGKRISLDKDVIHHPVSTKTTGSIAVSNHRLQCCPYACDKCNYRCKQKTNLKKHLLIHTGEKPFACDKCDFRCSQKGYLKKHLIIHTGEKPFGCDKCDYRGSQKDKLKRHRMTHTGDKPFACDKCGYRCSQKHKLKIHLMTHTGEKPFACDKCEYRSTHKFSLRKHLLKH